MYFSKAGFEHYVQNISEQHDSIDEIIALLLGFYVEVMMGRWWKQMESLPSVENLAVTLNTLVASGSSHALEFKKTLLRFSLLTFALRMSAVSKPFYKSFDSEDKFIQKGLASHAEMKLLRPDLGSKLGRYDKWWVPINWCCHEVHKASGPGMLIPKSTKEVLKQ